MGTHGDRRLNPEIQGLRAVSVLAVILFHAFGSLLPGGYVGVDIFFVISGYVISRLIAREMAEGEFSLARFYRNRVVRLMPNLFLMLIVATAISWWVLRPYDFFKFGKSLQLCGVYITNNHFARQQGYFDLGREVKPLLHTWSLSIEEQFYLLFPPALLVIARLKASRAAILVCLALASYAFKFWYLSTDRVIEAFFFLHARAWELLLGVLVALHPPKSLLRLTGWPRVGIAVLAAAAVAAALLFLDESVPYSGLLLFIPCLAAAVLILTASGTPVGRLLAWRRLVWIGGLSYSLYLWHWPLLVGLKNTRLNLGVVEEKILLLVLTGLVSWLAWKYVEEPCRRHRELVSGRAVAVGALAFALSCAAIGGVIYGHHGFESRFPNWVAVQQNLDRFDFQKATGVALPDMSACAIGDDPQVILRSCAFGQHGAAKRALVLGDSHVGAWLPAFQAAAVHRDREGVMAMLRGCPPLFGIVSMDGERNICAPGFDERISRLVEQGRFDQVFLVARWSLYSQGAFQRGELQRPSHFISDTNTLSKNAEDSRKVMSVALQRTVDFFRKHGVAVTVALPVPTLPDVVPELASGFTLPDAEYRTQTLFMELFVAAHPGTVTMIDPGEALCAGGACATRIGGSVLYSDDNHLSPAGAALMIRLIEPAFR